MKDLLLVPFRAVARGFLWLVGMAVVILPLAATIAAVWMLTKLL